MFLVDACPSTIIRSYTKPQWILVSYHSDDIIIMSANTSPDSDIEDNFSQPPAEEILQLIENTLIQGIQDH